MSTVPRFGVGPLPRWGSGGGEFRCVETILGDRSRPPIRPTQEVYWPQSGQVSSDRVAAVSKSTVPTRRFRTVACGHRRAPEVITPGAVVADWLDRLTPSSPDKVDSGPGHGTAPAGCRCGTCRGGYGGAGFRPRCRRSPGTTRLVRPGRTRPLCLPHGRCRSPRCGPIHAGVSRFPCTSIHR